MIDPVPLLASEDTLYNYQLNHAVVGPLGPFREANRPFLYDQLGERLGKYNDKCG